MNAEEALNALEIRAVGEISKDGLILPDGKFVSIRKTNPDETHAQILGAIQISKDELMRKKNIIHKLGNHFTYFAENDECIPIIENPLLKMHLNPDDIIVIDDVYNPVYKINFGEFTANNNHLPIKTIRSLWKSKDI
jgi:hypothetical protein